MDLFRFQARQRALSDLENLRARGGAREAHQEWWDLTGRVARRTLSLLLQIRSWGHLENAFERRRRNRNGRRIGRLGLAQLGGDPTRNLFPTKQESRK